MADTAPKNPFADTYPELASKGKGGRILFATDDFFAPAEGMLQDHDPVWDAQKFTPFGKWMDGWETRRKRVKGHDWSIIQLGLPGNIVGVLIDTGYFTGNQVPAISIQAAILSLTEFPQRRSEMGTAATEQEWQDAAKLESDKWIEILPRVKLSPGYPSSRYNYFEIPKELMSKVGSRCTHLRLNSYPDGGIARFRAYGYVQPLPSSWIPNQVYDLVSLENGGRSISCTNQHYGTPMNILAPGKSKGMYDGWETARNPNRPFVFETDEKDQLILPGSESCVIKLGHIGRVQTIVVDTNHFIGNYPESCLIEATHVSSENVTDLTDRERETWSWKPLIERAKLGPNQEHTLSNVLLHEPISHIRLTIYPDGGIARLRVFGWIA